MTLFIVHITKDYSIETFCGSTWRSVNQPLKTEYVFSHYVYSHSFRHNKNIWEHLSLITADEITTAAKNDSYILQKHEACVWQKMGELGPLLISGKKVAALKKMGQSFIDPHNYMRMITSVRNACVYNSETNSYRIPSLAKKLWISLMKLSKLIKAKALTEKNSCFFDKTKKSTKNAGVNWSLQQLPELLKKQSGMSCKKYL